MKFSQQVYEIVKAVSALEEAGYFAAMTYHTSGLDLGAETESNHAFVAVNVFNTRNEFMGEYSTPLIAEIISDNGTDNAAQLAERMLSIIKTQSRI